MTGEEIRQEAIRYSGFDITEEDALAWINEALRRLGDMGLVYGRLDVDAQAEVSYVLPPDALHIVRVEHRASRRPYDGWRLVGDEIIFHDTGQYTVYARRMPPPLQFIEEEPSVHMAFHQAIVFYVRGMAKLKDDDASPDGHALLQRFEEEATRVFRQLQRSRSPRTIRVIR